MRGPAVGKAVAIVLCLMSLGVLAYLLFAPVFTKGISALRPRDLGLEEAQRYYTLIGAAVTSILGTVGVFLGAFYYFDRLSWESDRISREIGRARLEDLYRRIDVIDELVEALVDANEANAETRGQVRKVLRALGSLEQLLDSAATSARMTDDDLADILRLYSRLDSQCRACLEMERPRESAEVGCDVIDPDEYWELLHDARKALQRCGGRLEVQSRE